MCDCEFGREQGLSVAQVALRGTLGLTCQRCMQALQFELDTDSRVALVASEAEAAAVPESWKRFWPRMGCCASPRWSRRKLLLALPIVPLHEPAIARWRRARVGRCVDGGAAGAGRAGDDAAVRRSAGAARARWQVNAVFRFWFS